MDKERNEEIKNNYDDSFAWKTINKLVKIIILLVFLLFTSNLAITGGFLYYLSLYDYSGTNTTTIEGQNGNANYIKGNGDIINGKDSRSLNENEN